MSASDASDAQLVLLSYSSCVNEQQKKILNYWGSKEANKVRFDLAYKEREENALFSKELF